MSPGCTNLKMLDSVQSKNGCFLLAIKSSQVRRSGWSGIKVIHGEIGMLTLSVRRLFMEGFGIRVRSL